MRPSSYLSNPSSSTKALKNAEPLHSPTYSDRGRVDCVPPPRLQTGLEHLAPSPAKAPVEHIGREATGSPLFEKPYYRAEQEWLLQTAKGSDGLKVMKLKTDLITVDTVDGQVVKPNTVQVHPQHTTRSAPASFVKT